MAEGVGGTGNHPDGDRGPHLPTPSIWPFGFASGVALLLVGLIVGWTITAVGAGITVVFGFLWIRDVTVSVRRAPASEPAAAPVLDQEDVEGEAVAIERFPRSTFLGGATLGLGGLIGAIVTVPPLGFAIAPAFVGQGYDDIDLGPLDNFPLGKFVTATFQSTEEGGNVSRRTAFIRNNGLVEGGPSFTIISNRCVHLGCPVQPNGIPLKPLEVEVEGRTVKLTQTQPNGFSCPCHGGAYDTEGNRTAGPPVRALDRYHYSIKNGNLVLGEPYSVAAVDGESSEAKIHAYSHADPGQHVDGVEQILYPYIP